MAETYCDAALFERLMLEINQAGLSWLTILKKRETFRFCPPVQSTGGFSSSVRPGQAPALDESSPRGTFA